METASPDPGQLEQILRRTSRIAVVGWSPNPERASHTISDALEELGWEVYRVRPGAGRPEVWDSLEDLPVPVDLVNVFRRPEAVPALVEPARRAGARVFWMQPGAESEEAARLARAAGLEPIQGACILATVKILGLRREAGAG